MQKEQKGQALVEFAFILPLLLFLIFAIFYISMIMADYLSLSSIARSSAREAAIMQEKNEVEHQYPTVKENYSDYKLPMDIYKWEPEKNFNIKYNNHNVTVTIKAELNEEGSILANIVNGLAERTNSNFDLNITYTMYSEYTPK